MAYFFQFQLRISEIMSNDIQPVSNQKQNNFNGIVSYFILANYLYLNQNIFCYINNQHILQQSAMSRLPRRFPSKQMAILKQIVIEKKENQKIQIYQITDEFNQKCRESISDFQAKNVRSVHKIVKDIVKTFQHFWSSQMNNIMMESVSKGQAWKSIQKLPGIAEHNLTGDQIKRKFQCCMRNKFRCIYKHAYNSEPPNISDRVFKTLIQKEKILEYQDLEIITKQQSSCLVNNIHVFMLSLEDKDIHMRTKLEKQRIINTVNPEYPLDTLLKTILKLNQQANKKIDLSLNLLNKSSSTLVNLELPIAHNHQETCSILQNDLKLNEQSIFYSDNETDQKENKRMNQISKQQAYLDQEADVYTIKYLL